MSSKNEKEEYAKIRYGVSNDTLEQFLDNLKKINFGSLNRKLKKANLTLKGRKFKDLNDLIRYFRLLITTTLKKLDATDEELFMFFTVMTSRTSNEIDLEAMDLKLPSRFRS